MYAAQRSRFPGLALNNISCGGATTTSVLNGSNCGKGFTQMVEAEDFLRSHRGKVSFVTIDIGGNDASGCVGVGGVDQTCATNAAATIQTNLTSILARLKAAYPGIKVFGMNYYTPQLAFWLTGPSGQAVAQASVPAAHAFNEQLTNIYTAAGFRTADVSTAFENDNLAMTGLYKSITVPQNVANLCNWTLQCSNNDVHANNTGHAKLATAFTTVINAAMPPLSITTPSLPAGTIGSAHSSKVVAVGGTAPYRFKKIGKLPQGLKLTPTTGAITGIPKKKTGTFSFQVRAIDKAKPKATATRTYSIKIT